MAHAVVKDGPYFSGTGPISFSDLRSQWLGVNSGPVKASTFFRNLNRDVPNPVVGDSTENADIASDPFNAESFEYIGTGGFAFSGTGRDWKISQMRGSIKSYTINQTNSGDYDKNVDGDNLAWNSNLDKTIPKYYNIQGNIHAVTDLQPPTTEPDNALKFVSDNITNLNLVVSGSVLGSGGKGGYYIDKFNLGNQRGEPGGHAIKLNSNDGKGIAVNVTNTGKIYGGGGGGGQGGTGSKGPDGVYYYPRVTGTSVYYKGVATLSVTGTGSGYTDGTYTATATTGGNGNGLTVTVTVSSGTFSSVAVVNTGTYYRVGDVITIPAVGSGSGLTVTVTTIYELNEWYSYQVGGNCQCEWYSSCGDSTNDSWHWSVDEDNYSIQDGGTGYQVGDIVTINDARKSDGATGNTVNATAEVTSVNASVGAYISDGTDGNNPGDIVATGSGTKQIKIRMGWNDRTDYSIGIGQYKVPSLGVDFTQGIRTYSRGQYDSESSSPWSYGNGRFYRWRFGDGNQFGYATYINILGYEALSDDSGDQRYVGYGPEGIQVPQYSRDNYVDGNGNPNETAPWTQLITVTGGNVYPCTLIKPQDVPGRNGFSQSNDGNFYDGADNNTTASLNNWFFFTNRQQRMYFKDADGNDGNTAIWLSEANETISFGYQAANDPNANNNTNTAFDSALPVVGESFVDGIKILTGGKRYYKDWYNETVQTTSGGSGSGLKIFITTNRGWLRDASNTKHETRSGYGGTVLQLGGGTYMSNKAGGGCDRHWSGLYWKKTCIGAAYCIVEDPAMGVGAEGGAGGFGGQGKGSNGVGNALMTRTDGADGVDGDIANPPTTTTDGGDGGNGGNGGDWGVAGGDGQDGQCNIVCQNPEDGSDGGAAGRAIFGTNYTVNDSNFNSTRVKGAYQPS